MGLWGALRSKAVSTRVDLAVSVSFGHSSVFTLWCVYLLSDNVNCAGNYKVLSGNTGNKLCYFTPLYSSSDTFRLHISNVCQIVLKLTNEVIESFYLLLCYFFFVYIIYIFLYISTDMKLQTVSNFRLLFFNAMANVIIDY